MIETGLLAAFLVPFFDGRPFPKRPTPIPVIWLFRWLLFRVELGTALIKVRADECWKTLTCLYYHFETNPIPNPLSPWFHYLPRPVLQYGGSFTLFAQLIPPWFFFGPRTLRILAGLLTLLMQALITASGNYSFFNWLTILPIFSCSMMRFSSDFFRSDWLRGQNALKQRPSGIWHEHLAWVFFSVTILLASRSCAISHRASGNECLLQRLGHRNSYGASEVSERGSMTHHRGLRQA
jgi:hypothetical protein